MALCSGDMQVEESGETRSVLVSSWPSLMLWRLRGDDVDSSSMIRTDDVDFVFLGDDDDDGDDGNK